jgi:hypothetical protein
MVKQIIVVSNNDKRLEQLLSKLKIVSRKCAVIWALECAKELLAIFESRSTDHRPKVAIEDGYRWAKGEIKMTFAKKSILNAHQAAKDALPDMVAFCIARAIGQAVSTIHSKKHAIGIVLYACSASYHNTDIKHQDDDVDQLVEWFYNELCKWEQEIHHLNMSWAPFLDR